MEKGWERKKADTNSLNHIFHRIRNKGRANHINRSLSKFFLQIEIGPLLSVPWRTGVARCQSDTQWHSLNSLIVDFVHLFIRSNARNKFIFPLFYLFSSSSLHSFRSRSRTTLHSLTPLAECEIQPLSFSSGIYLQTTSTLSGRIQCRQRGKQFSIRRISYPFREMCSCSLRSQIFDIFGVWPARCWYTFAIVSSAHMCESPNGILPSFVQRFGWQCKQINLIQSLQWVECNYRCSLLPAQIILHGMLRIAHPYPHHPGTWTNYSCAARVLKVLILLDTKTGSNVQYRKIWTRAVELGVGGAMLRKLICAKWAHGVYMFGTHYVINLQVDYMHITLRNRQHKQKRRSTGAQPKFWIIPVYHICDT